MLAATYKVFGLTNSPYKIIQLLATLALVYLVRKSPESGSRPESMVESQEPEHSEES